MIIAYTTDDYFHWAELFMKSFSLFHKNEKIYLNSVNLSNKEMDKLYKLYDNLVIDNRNISISELSDMYGVSKKDLIESRENCTTKKSGGKHRLWMNVHADGLRIERLYETILANKNEESFLHLDIDILIRKNIKHIIYDGTGDVGLKFRVGKNHPDDKISELTIDTRMQNKKKDALINIGAVVIKNNDKGRLFMDEWYHHIVNTPMKRKNGIKWGQYAVALAFMETRNKVKFYRPESSFFDSELLNESSGWFFKTKDKNKSYQTALKELKRLENYK